MTTLSEEQMAGLKSYLADHLSIGIETGYENDYGTEYVTVRVKLHLGEEMISEAYDTIRKI